MEVTPLHFLFPRPCFQMANYCPRQFCLFVCGVGIGHAVLKQCEPNRLRHVEAQVDGVRAPALAVTSLALACKPLVALGAGFGLGHADLDLA